MLSILMKLGNRLNVISGSIISFSMIILLTCCSRQQAPDEQHINESTPRDSTEIRGQVKETVSYYSLFQKNFKKAEDSLISWGFDSPYQVQYNSIDKFKTHWLLKTAFRQSIISNIERYNYRKENIPDSSDWHQIKQINQYKFGHGWQFVLEEWQFINGSAALNWLSKIRMLTRLDDAKPPRVFWLENDRIYFIMSVAARDWFEKSAELIHLMAGTTQFNIELRNVLLDLPALKLALGQSNSGLYTLPNYCFMPDSSGFGYRYFWFISLRQQHREQAINGLELYSYVNNEVADFYNTNKEIIGLKIALDDRKLGRRNLVGRNVDELLMSLGLNKTTSDSIDIVKFENDVLFLHSQNREITRLSYLRLASADSLHIQRAIADGW